tara:strand:- start:780 stop:1271 length:492 start_codon:yes stop_codon:yes gene_type:complete
MIRRLIPHPLLSFALLLFWLVLTSFSVGNLLLGGVIALFAGTMMAKLQPATPRLRRVILLPKLFGIVFYDIIRSNLAVSWLIITRGRRGTRHSGFVPLDLELKDPTALALLSMIITATPGSAWIEYSADTDHLVVHVFDLIDEDLWRAQIKGRYESLLMEIFQ